MVPAAFTASRRGCSCSRFCSAVAVAGETGIVLPWSVVFGDVSNGGGTATPSVDSNGDTAATDDGSTATTTAACE